MGASSFFRRIGLLVGPKVVAGLDGAAFVVTGFAGAVLVVADLDGAVTVVALP